MALLVMTRGLRRRLGVGALGDGGGGSGGGVLFSFGHWNQLVLEACMLGAAQSQDKP